MKLSPLLGLPIAEPEDFTTNFPTEVDEPRTMGIEGFLDTFVRGAPSGFRNVIRNGDMSIAQRGNGPFPADSSYGLDNWRVWSSNAALSSAERVTEDLAYDGATYQSFTVTGQTAPTDVAFLQTFVEDAFTLAGRAAVLSFDAWAAAGTPKVSFYFEQAGTSNPAFLAGPVTISQARQRYKVHIQMPEVVGAPAAGHCIIIGFYVSAGADQPNGNGIGLQNNTFNFTDVQLEEGSVATPFERLPQQQQLAWCQRYYYRAGQGSGLMPASTATRVASGLVGAGGRGDLICQFPVQMRTGPTMGRIGGLSAWLVNYGPGAPATTDISVGEYPPMPTHAHIWATSPGLVVSSGAQLLIYSTTSAHLEFSAEF